MSSDNRPFYLPVHVAKTLALYEGATDEEFGAAMRLLLRTWLASDPPLSIPGDEASLARITCGGKPADRVSREVILRGWTLGNDERMHHHGMRREYDAARSRQIEASRKGKKGASARWHPPNDAPAMPQLCPSHSTGMPKSQSKNQNQREPNPPLSPPLAMPAPSAGERRSDGGVHPAQAFGLRPQIDAILAAFPNRAGGNRARDAVASAIRRIGSGNDDAWPGGLPRPPTAADAAEWLLGRVRAYAASSEAKREGGRFALAVIRWMDEARYCDDDSAWNRTPELGRATGSARADADRRREAILAGQHPEHDAPQPRTL